MLKILFLKEVLETLKSAKFLVVVGSYILFIPLALYSGQVQYESRQAAYLEATTIYERGLRGFAGSLDIHPQALYRPSPLSVFSRDMIPYIPQGFLLSAENGAQIAVGKIPPPLLEKTFGSFDLLFVITVLVSLLSVLVLYDALSGEKERGTLRMVLSNPISRAQLFLAKYLGALLATTLALLLGFLLGLIVLLLTTNISVGSELLMVLLLVFLLTVLYSSASLLIGLSASTFTHRMSNSLLVGVLLWVILVSAIPRLSQLVAQRLAPVETAEALSLREELLRKDIQERQNGELERIFNDADYTSARQPIVDQYRVELTNALKTQQADYLRKRSSQDRLALLLGSLSPVTHVTHALTELTATGFSAVDRLLEDVRLYEETTANEVYRLGYRDQIPNKGVRMVFEPVNLEGLARFKQSVPTLGERFQNSALSILFLVVFNIVLFALAYVKGIRYDPR